MNNNCSYVDCLRYAFHVDMFTEPTKLIHGNARLQSSKTDFFNTYFNDRKNVEVISALIHLKIYFSVSI